MNVKMSRVTITILTYLVQQFPLPNAKPDASVNLVMFVIAKESVFYQQHVQSNGVDGTKPGPLVAVHSVKELVLNLIKAILLVEHVKPDANVSLDMSETKQDTVSHGVNVLHKIHAVPMNTTHIAEAHVKNQNVAVCNHMDTSAMLKDFRFNVLLFVKNDANVSLDMFVMMLLTVTVMENVLPSTSVCQILSRHQQLFQLPLQHHQLTD